MHDLWIQNEFFFQLAEIFSLSINILQGRSKDALINIVNNFAYQLINKTTTKNLYLVFCWQTVKLQTAGMLRSK